MSRGSGIGPAEFVRAHSGPLTRRLFEATAPMVRVQWRACRESGSLWGDGKPGVRSCTFVRTPLFIPPPIQAFRLSGGGFSSVFICLLFPLTRAFKCFEVVSEPRQPDLSIGPLRRSTGNPLEATMFRLEVRKPSLHGAPSVPVFLLRLGSLHSLLQSIDRAPRALGDAREGNRGAAGRKPGRS